MSDFSSYFELQRFNVLKLTLILAIGLFLVSYYFYHRKTQTGRIISYCFISLAMCCLFFNNIWVQKYSMDNEVVPYTTIDELDEERILSNYAVIQSEYGASKPTTWFEDGDYNVDNNIYNYPHITIDLAYLVHKQTNNDVTVLEFYAYYTKNGESTIEGSSHLHDFSKYYLYFYENETKAFAIGYSTYDYQNRKHDWRFRSYTGYIDGHEILVHDVSTNEYYDEEIQYSDKQISENFNRYTFDPKTMNEYETLAFVTFTIIFVIAWVGLVRSFVPKKRVNFYGNIVSEYRQSSGWIFLIIISGIFMLYFPLRTNSQYYTEFTFYYYDEDETPPSYFWQGGDEYIQFYGGAPFMKSDWTNYDYTQYSELVDIFDLYTYHNRQYSSL